MDAENSDTPRTNSEEIELEDGEGRIVDAVLSSFARKLERELNELQAWKRSMLEYCKRWDETDSFVRNHPDALISADVSILTRTWLKERDSLRRQNEKLREALRYIARCPMGSHLKLEDAPELARKALADQPEEKTK